MDPILFSINMACSVLAVVGCITLATREDNLRGWQVYTAAAIIGIVYFIAMTVRDIEFAPQIVVWASFLLGDVLALRRKWKAKRRGDMNGRT
jgi:hypothetical protein